MFYFGGIKISKKRMIFWVVYYFVGKCSTTGNEKPKITIDWKLKYSPCADGFFIDDKVLYAACFSAFTSYIYYNYNIDSF